MRVALTGGVASGKSAASAMFADLGVPVVDADVLARRVVVPGSPGLEALVERYGNRILDDTGTLDRTALREIIFEDAEEKQAVESILHPLIREAADRESERALKRGKPYVLHVIPLLVETDQASRFDRVLVIDVPEAVQIERLMARDGVDIDRAHSMLEAQASREARLAVADEVVENTTGLCDLRRRIGERHAHYMALLGTPEPAQQ